MDFKDSFRDPIGRLRTVGIIEGISFLVLLLIAMPLKYLAEMPLAVRVVGMAHGGLWIWFLYELFSRVAEKKLPIVDAGKAFFASVIPFGPWLIDKRLREIQESSASA